MPIAEITRAETARRAEQVTVRSYDVTLDFTRGEEVFGSTSVISFDATQLGTRTYVDLIAHNVHAVTFNGRALNPAVAYDGARLTLPDALEDHNELTVVAECSYTHSGTGVHRSVDPADGRVYVYGKFTPAHARAAYACFEQPDLKAPFALHVTAPAGWAVLSNTEPVITERPVASAPGNSAAGNSAAGNSATWHFAPTPPLPTFATTVVAGGYHVVTGEHVTPDGRTIPLRAACRDSRKDDLDAGWLFGLTGQGLDYYERLLGRPYPYPVYGHAFVPEFSAGATEKPGCVLMSENLLFHGTVTAAQDELRTMIVLHEMAHMWFGNLVTFRWWDDLWLSESCAEFCGHDACVRLGLHPGAWSTFSLTRKTWGFAADRMPTTHPVAADAATLSDAMANFDGISYAKGASVLRQLCGYVGEDAFFGGISDYLAAHAHLNAALPDLLDAIAARAGQDLSAWARDWLQTPGLNTLRAEFETGPDGTFTSFAVTQEAPAACPVLRPHRLRIGVWERSGETVGGGRSVHIEAAGARTDVPELLGAPRGDLIIVNDDDLGFAATRFDPRSLSFALAHAGEIDDPVARAVVWDALADMVTEAELPVPAFAAAVAAGLRLEPSVARAQALTLLAWQRIERFAGPADAAAGKQRLAAVAADLLISAEPGSDLQVAWAELLAWTASDRPELDLVAALLSGDARVPGLALEPELRWSLLRRLAATGRAGQAEIAAAAERDRTDAGHRHATACRAALPDPRAKKSAWALLTGGTLGPDTVRLVARAFGLPEHADLLAPYADAYLPALADVWDQRGGHLRALLGQLLFPLPVVTAGLLADMASFAAGRSDDRGLTRLLAELGDLGERSLRSRTLPSLSGTSGC
ncbi:MAG TPA: aminopeptidase N [Trebonia sp.]